MTKIKKEKNKNSHGILVGSFLILLGVSLPLSKFIYENHLNHKEEKNVEQFFEIQEQVEIVPTKEEELPKKEKVQSSYNYIGVLEIPSISLKRGLVDVQDKANRVDKNIQILKESDMPDVVNGTFMLASHSGSGRIAFFKNLHKVKHGENIHIYYNNVKYTYQVVKTYKEPKDGDIVIHRDKNKTTLVLTTCSQASKESQYVVICELVKKEKY